MSSTREAVSLSGILRNETHEATCVVDAIKVGLPGSGQFDYTRYSVRNVSKSLPDGVYELVANGQSLRLRHERGSWLSAEG